MFQDIAPHALNTKYTPRPVQAADYVIVLHNNQLLLEAGQLPTFADLQQHYSQSLADPIYLLSVEKTHFFYLNTTLATDDAYRYASLNVFRTLQPKWLAFAAVTAAHLAAWYRDNQFCGRCGQILTRGSEQRELICPNCGLEIFPKISPVIIVGVKHGERLLLTKYAAQSGYSHYALIAGFVEIGETLEGAIRREVFEETGLEVKNAQYFQSQPWGFSQSILMGFFADLADDAYDTALYKDDRGELSERKWFERQVIPDDDTTLSLTWTMIKAFHNGEIA
ncbi:NAD(+) diphosphatase [Loigolactobacillus bifermentans]|uniref:NAD(+) diphosphatase n=1 Tax=Loigolactobacillus bifermentans DSM 20003 TaxID=1423726 RepID=A0A0R1GM83_9LACO|nr:NAD(+) diphosphatase [Loigolactobacillus bifermentans]KRK35118.1 pyrophosphatase [Loigolactobacillus bifermentans DSM 20003]QGG59205.1 NAD(+) diphosphatase [Loigolactobacillus bifermentans]